jgi:hypothetical protein
MMSLWDALRMNMMISYQELVRTFLNKDAIICQAGYWVPRYYDLESNDIRKNKMCCLGCGYTNNICARHAFWYPDSSQQQPWNGDYSYSFGYAGYTRDRSLCSMPTMPVPATGA